MRILVLGAGALGSVIATKLTNAGVDVVALEANPAHAELCRDPGPRIELPDGSSITVPLQVAESVDQLGDEPFDYALITLKAPVIPTVLEALAARDLVKTYVSLGNGLVQDVIAGLVGEERLLVGTVSWGATFLGPGHVRQTTLAPFAVGDLHPEIDPERLPRLIEALSHVAAAHTTDTIVGQVWAKLLLNSALSGLGTAVGAEYAQVVADPRGRAVSQGMWTEGLRVAEAIGVQLDGDVAGINPYEIDVDGPGGFEQASRTMDKLLEALGKTKASMWQDLERGIKTEVDVINGSIVRVGAENGVPTPLNALCAEIIRECERGEARPQMENLARFEALLPDRSQ